ncbi:MAG: DUF1902 domain-containing protein [Defluviitaleaceae bacterium]|nr:DUF1902 domain-containing protein [Defluviitaleaceae bacterium]MCL2836044.1 DUF1902 domain-containing protein [Defluviitaleaceae bacterium]
MNNEYKINFMRDDEADVWIATSKDVYGLILHRKGDHDTWFSPITNKPISVDGKIKSRHTANGILK